MTFAKILPFCNSYPVRQGSGSSQDKPPLASSGDHLYERNEIQMYNTMCYMLKCDLNHMQTVD